MDFRAKKFIASGAGLLPLNGSLTPVLTAGNIAVYNDKRIISRCKYLILEPNILKKLFLKKTFAMFKFLL